MCDQGPPGREGAPLMVSGAFAVEATKKERIKVQCAMLMTYKMSSTSFTTAPIRTCSLYMQDLCVSVSYHRLPLCVCFSEPEQQ